MPTTPKVVTFAIIKSRKSYTTTQKVGTRHAVSEQAKRVKIDMLCPLRPHRGRTK